MQASDVVAGIQVLSPSLLPPRVNLGRKLESASQHSNPSTLLEGFSCPIDVLANCHTNAPIFFYCFYATGNRFLALKIKDDLNKSFAFITSLKVEINFSAKLKQNKTKVTLGCIQKMNCIFL